jgi:hypothetical protein
VKKTIFVTLMVLALLALGGLTSVFAQDEDAIQIAYGDVVDGEIDNDQFEVNYVFTGSEDDIILIEMFPEPGTYGLDPKLQLKDDDGDILFENDDFLYPASVIVTSLRDDGEFTITATRYNGEEGTSEGDYMLRLSVVEPIELGSTVDTQIFATSETEESVLPQFLVLYSEDDINITVTMAMEEGELFASLRMATPDAEAYGGYNTLVDFNPGVPIYNLSFTVDLEDEQIYVIYATRAFASYSFDAEPLDVSITVEES